MKMQKCYPSFPQSVAAMVEQAWQNLRSAYGQYKGYVEQVNAYGESFRTAEIRFNAGCYHFS